MDLINSHTLGLDTLAGSAADTAGILGSIPQFLTSDPPASPASAGDPSFSGIFAFGDSLSDDGNVYTASQELLPAAPYWDGRFSNGPVWVEDLAQRLGLPDPHPSLQGGTDFAYGGGKTGQEPLHTATPGDLPWQLAQYGAQNPLPQPNALYTLWIGSNDVLDAVSAYAGNPAAANSDITQAVANETAFVDGLAHLGAHNFLILNVPDLGKTPQETAHGPGVAQTASTLSAQYDAELNASLGAIAAQDSLNLHVIDTYSLLDQAVANPGAFGFTNVTDPVWTGNFYDLNSGHFNTAGAAQSGFLFFDNLHPTATTHSMLAAAAQQSLAGSAVA